MLRTLELQRQPFDDTSMPRWLQSRASTWQTSDEFCWTSTDDVVNGIDGEDAEDGFNLDLARS